MSIVLKMSREVIQKTDKQLIGANPYTLALPYLKQ